MDHKERYGLDAGLRSLRDRLARVLAGAGAALDADEAVVDGVEDRLQPAAAPCASAQITTTGRRQRMRELLLLASGFSVRITQSFFRGDNYSTGETGRQRWVESTKLWFLSVTGWLSCGRWGRGLK